jgi:outer membrane protein assembly factor BamE (lipoprotein component of BamABCDE complex)
MIITFNNTSIITKIILILIVSFSFTGCQTVDVHGQFIDNKTIEQLETTRLTKEQVIELVGTPTAVPEYSNDTWYYIQRSIAKRAWFSPRVSEQRIVKITFQDNYVNSIEVLQEDETHEIQVVKEYTKNYGTELNGVQKFIKNIGRFNQTSNSKSKKKSK